MTASIFYTGMLGPDAIVALNRLWDRVSSVFTLTDAATVSIDVSRDERIQHITLGGNRTLNLAGNGVALGDGTLASLDGKMLMLRVQQDGTGSRVPTLGTGFRFGTAFSSVPFTATAGKVDYVGVIYRHAAACCDVVSYSLGY